MIVELSVSRKKASHEAQDKGDFGKPDIICQLPEEVGKAMPRIYLQRHK